jgi:hypothetical protein
MRRVLVGEVFIKCVAVFIGVLPGRFWGFLELKEKGKPQDKFSARFRSDSRQETFSRKVE